MAKKVTSRLEVLDITFSFKQFTYCSPPGYGPCYFLKYQIKKALHYHIFFLTMTFPIFPGCTLLVVVVFDSVRNGLRGM